ncbi:MAG: 2-oxo acid dehydrogenase subunit E2 [Bacilli bacterium]|nr:2-oxo acid dehydrogenase subunit E2 [Bacilli bacterium]
MNFVTKRKRKFGDRKDGHLMKDAPVMNRLMATLYPNRCDNEVSSTINVDITNLMNFVKEHNQSDPNRPIKFFHCFLAALTRVLNERRLLLRFVQNGKLYERDEIKISFTAKRGFSDHAEEAIISYIPKATDNVYDVASFILGQVKDCRDPEKIAAEKADNHSMESLEKLPHWLFRFVARTLRFLDRHGGKLPADVLKEDPSFSTAMVANLGSIKANSVYHHLNNYGSCSMMLTIGTIKETIIDNQKRYVVDITSTFDERIADGFYFIHSVDVMKKYLENPQLLEKPFGEEIAN